LATRERAALKDKPRATIEEQRADLAADMHKLLRAASKRLDVINTLGSTAAPSRSTIAM
jgi:hypothetical protein